ncbi:MAG: hypothetical protein KGJ43_05115, partial [Acidobacteriota bacterium]|nr:hypothetical protein [Acidobacteriota bacterium]
FRLQLAVSPQEGAPHDPPERLCGQLQSRDREVVEHWRAASADAHARAMIELSRYATAMVRQTGLGKRGGEMFPGFPAGRPKALPAGIGHARG